MKLRRLRIQHVRNHIEFMCEFSDHATLIYGKNGAGKTSLLEAIYTGYRGTSFRGSDGDVLHRSYQWYRIDIADESLFSRTVILDSRGERPRKEFTIDDKKSARLPARYKRPVVLFTPNDLRLIDGSPARRREYLDVILSQLDERYATMRRRYERTLLQRNKLLKTRAVQPEQLFSWNVILAEAGAYIINARNEYVTQMNSRLSIHYQTIASSHDTTTAQYTHVATSAQKLLSQYEQSFDADILRGNTLIGPHRHDLLFFLRDELAIDTASRGEMRTIIIAMKYIEAEMLYARYKDYPLVLLDDVYGELDMSRRRNLSQTLKEYQIIITSTDKVTGLPRGTHRIELG